MVGRVVAGAGAVDGPLDGKLDGDLLGDRDGDGVAVGDGADHVTSWHPDFMEADVLSGVLSVGRGARVGSSSIGAGDKAQP